MSYSSTIHINSHNDDKTHFNLLYMKQHKYLNLKYINYILYIANN